jgi:hypothetical protein
MFYVHEVRNLCVPAIFERWRGALGSKISGGGQLAEVAVYFAMSGPPPCSRGMISSRRLVAPQSALLCANAVPQAIDSVTRVSSRVEFIESEFNGTGARSPYIQYQVSASDAASR